MVELEVCCLAASSRKDLLPTVERVISKQSPAVCSFQPWRVALSTSCPSQDSPGPELSVIKTHSLRLSDGPKVPARLTGVLSGERSLFPQVHPASFLSFHLLGLSLILALIFTDSKEPFLFSMTLKESKWFMLPGNILPIHLTPARLPDPYLNPQSWYPQRLVQALCSINACWLSEFMHEWMDEQANKWMNK